MGNAPSPSSSLPPPVVDHGSSSVDGTTPLQLRVRQFMEDIMVTQNAQGAVDIDPAVGIEAPFARLHFLFSQCGRTLKEPHIAIIHLSDHHTGSEGSYERCWEADRHVFGELFARFGDDAMGILPVEVRWHQHGVLCRHVTLFGIAVDRRLWFFDPSPKTNPLPMVTWMRGPTVIDVRGASLPTIVVSTLFATLVCCLGAHTVEAVSQLAQAILGAQGDDHWQQQPWVLRWYASLSVCDREEDIARLCGLRGADPAETRACGAFVVAASTTTTGCCTNHPKGGGSRTLCEEHWRAIVRPVEGESFSPCYNFATFRWTTTAKGCLRAATTEQLLDFHYRVWALTLLSGGHTVIMASSPCACRGRGSGVHGRRPAARLLPLRGQGGLCARVGPPFVPFPNQGTRHKKGGEAQSTKTSALRRATACSTPIQRGGRARPGRLSLSRQGPVRRAGRTWRSCARRWICWSGTPRSSRT